MIITPLPYILHLISHSYICRILICPIVYAPKYCDNRLSAEENMLQKVIEVNRWIHNFNKENTGKFECRNSHGVSDVYT